MKNEQQTVTDLQRHLKELATLIHFQFKSMRFKIDTLKHEVRCLKLSPEEARRVSRERMSQHFEKTQLKHLQEEEDQLRNLLTKINASIYGL